MPATKKSESVPHEAETRRSEPAPSTSLEDVSDSQDVQGTDSPARRMQAELQESMAGKGAGRQRPDLGRVLAVSSGITTLLGVFIFSGIW